MRKILRNVVSAALAATLVAGGLAGCSFAPKDTPTLLEEVRKAENTDNYHMTGTISLDATSGNAFTVTTVYDAAGRQAHSTYDSTIVGTATKGEGYVTPVADDSEALVSYDSVDMFGNTVWVKSTVGYVTPLECLSTLPALDEATFAAGDKTYSLTVPADAFYDGLVSSVPALAGTKALLGEGMEAALKEAVATYTYDESFHLTTIACSVSFTSDDEQSTLTLNVHYDVSGYGSVDATTLAVPEAVTTDAVDSDEIQNSILELGDQIGNVVNEVVNSVDAVLTELGTFVTDISNQLPIGGEEVEEVDKGGQETDATGTTVSTGTTDAATETEAATA